MAVLLSVTSSTITQTVKSASLPPTVAKSLTCLYSFLFLNITHWEEGGGFDDITALRNCW